MGSAPSSPIATCLLAAVGGDSSLVAFPLNPLYQLQHVKPYNLDISVAPVAITYPRTNEQVAAVVSCASSIAGLTVQARGGGHSYANYAVGGGDTDTIVVDVKNFQQFSMDNTTGYATIGSGTRLGDVTSRLLSAGNRAIAHGTCPDVGIGGHASMGGLGPLSRQWGSAMDHVIEVTTILANSSIITASPTQNPDVFWTMKGAAASFGIITEFKVLTHPAPTEAVQYSYTFAQRPYSTLAPRFKAWQTLISSPTLSRKFASQVVITELGMIISGTFFGSQSEWDSLNMTTIFPDHSTSNVTVFNDYLGLVGHWAEDVALNAGALQSAFYSKSLAFTPSDLMSDATVDAFFTNLDTVSRGTLIWFAIFDLEGGAINDIPANATAYGHRDTLFYLQTYGVDLIKVSTTTRGFIQGMSDIVEKGLNRTLGSYAGYVDPALVDAQQRYFGGNLGELQKLKGVIDPGDLFHNPQSIRLGS